jgi:peptidyl-prolyl cis-trans isomerase C
VKYRILAAIAVSVLASGCNRKAEGQTVAVVNGEEVTAPDLNFALNQLKVPEGADKAAARAQVLEQLVDKRLLAEQARKEGIDKTPEYLNQQRQADENLLIQMLATKRLNTAQLPSDREVQNYIATHPEMFDKRETWTLDQLVYATPTDPKIKQQIMDAHSMDQLVTVLQNDKVAFARQKNRLDTAAVPAELYGKLNTLPAGEPFALSTGGRTVTSAIVAREPVPISGDQAKPIAVDAMRKAQTGKALESLMKSLRSSAKIEYQSGYGPPKKS